MTNLRLMGLMCIFAGALSVSPAIAAGEGGHGDPHAAAAADHGGEHGAGAEHHANYSADDDHDGTANWLDSDSGDYMVPKLGFHAVNLALLLAFLVVYAGPGIRDGVRANALLVSRSLNEAAKLKADAAAHHETVSKRLGELSAEISAIESRAKAEAEAEEKRIRQRADEAAVRIADSAQRQIRDEATRARQAIRKESVELALQLAESILRGQVGADDQRRLAQEFVDTISSEGVSHV